MHLREIEDELGDSLDRESGVDLRELGDIQFLDPLLETQIQHFKYTRLKMHTALLFRLERLAGAFS